MYVGAGTCGCQRHIVCMLVLEHVGASTILYDSVYAGNCWCKYHIVFVDNGMCWYQCRIYAFTVHRTLQEGTYMIHKLL
jgi:hypothetical protein